jgi:hypothetical protein
MSSEDKPKKPMPSVAEINAYLELSAARTKKRLPLAFNKTSAPKPAPLERKLRLTGAEASKGKLPGASLEPGATPQDTSAEPAWAPAPNKDAK